MVVHRARRLGWVTESCTILGICSSIIRRANKVLFSAQSVPILLVFAHSHIGTPTSCGGKVERGKYNRYLGWKKRAGERKIRFLLALNSVVSTYNNFETLLS
jgi:hypothetical protein